MKAASYCHTLFGRSLWSAISCQRQVVLSMLIYWVQATVQRNYRDDFTRLYVSFGVSCVLFLIFSLFFFLHFSLIEGGRLQKELSYTSEALGVAAASTHQLVIQTPRDPGANILHPAALKEHLAILKAATQVTVHLFDMWVYFSPYFFPFHCLARYFNVYEVGRKYWMATLYDISILFFSIRNLQ